MPTTLRPSTAPSAARSALTPIQAARAAAAKLLKWTPLDRFFDKVVVEAFPRIEGLSPCWWWVRARTTGGKTAGRNISASPYAAFWFAGRVWRAHIWIWEQMTGRKLKKRFHLDHRCENTLCVNWTHLQEKPGRWNVQKANHNRWGKAA